MGLVGTFESKWRLHASLDKFYCTESLLHHPSQRRCNAVSHSCPESMSNSLDNEVTCLKASALFSRSCDKNKLTKANSWSRDSSQLTFQTQYIMAGESRLQTLAAAGYLASTNRKQEAGSRKLEAGSRICKWKSSACFSTSCSSGHLTRESPV